MAKVKAHSRAGKYVNDSGAARSRQEGRGGHLSKKMSRKGSGWVNLWER